MSNRILAKDVLPDTNYYTQKNVELILVEIDPVGQKAMMRTKANEMIPVPFNYELLLSPEIPGNSSGLPAKNMNNNVPAVVAKAGMGPNDFEARNTQEPPPSSVVPQSNSASSMELAGETVEKEKPKGKPGRKKKGESTGKPKKTAKVRTPEEEVLYQEEQVLRNKIKAIKENQKALKKKLKVPTAYICGLRSVDKTNKALAEALRAGTTFSQFCELAGTRGAAKTFSSIFRGLQSQRIAFVFTGDGILKVNKIVPVVE